MWVLVEVKSDYEWHPELINHVTGARAPVIPPRSTTFAGRPGPEPIVWVKFPGCVRQSDTIKGLGIPINELWPKDAAQ